MDNHGYEVDEKGSVRLHSIKTVEENNRAEVSNYDFKKSVIKFWYMKLNNIIMNLNCISTNKIIIYFLTILE